MTEKDLLAVACEQFLGKTVTEIKSVLLQTLEGHLRSILGTETTNNNVVLMRIILVDDFRSILHQLLRNKMFSFFKMNLNVGTYLTYHYSCTFY